MKKITVTLNNVHREISVVGKSSYGDSKVLLVEDDNIIGQTDFDERGYTVAKFSDAEIYKQLCDGIRSLLSTLIFDATGVCFGNDFSLPDYHLFVTTDEMHRLIIEKLRNGFELEEMPIRLDIIEKRVSEICGITLAAKNPNLSEQRFYVRVVRPDGKNDNNPPHRDVWLDYYRSCVNIYLPICGSNELSALPLIPGSHYWSESEIERTLDGAVVQGYEYRVPSVTNAKRSLEFIRPDPKPNELMLFSPYLIHGGGVNLNKAVTRMSLEMRFFRA